MTSLQLGAKGAATAGLVLLLAVLAARAMGSMGETRAWLLQQSGWQMAACSFFLLAVVALGQDWLLKGMSEWKVQRSAAKAPSVSEDLRYRQAHQAASERAQASMQAAAAEAFKRKREERAAAAEAAAQLLEASRCEKERLQVAIQAADAKRVADAAAAAAEGARVAEEVRERRALRVEQDDEYQQSLRADREKAAKLAKAHERRADAEESRQQRLEALRNSLSAEPAAGEQGCASIRVRRRDGSTLTRAFLQTDDVRVIHDWLKSVEAVELDSSAHKLVTPFPRTELPAGGATLAELGLAPQAVLALELP
eukprot:jgi/Tetstr1/426317/TSEL_016633.t1